MGEDDRLSAAAPRVGTFSTGEQWLIDAWRGTADATRATADAKGGTAIVNGDAADVRGGTPDLGGGTSVDWAAEEMGGTLDAMTEQLSILVQRGDGSIYFNRRSIVCQG